MKTIIVDHQDSFTYNIVELISQAVSVTPDVIPAKNLDIKTLNQYDKIILSPGPGLPRDFVNIKQILDTYKTNKHILGICLGHQAIATYFGGQLYNLNQVVHGQPKSVKIIRTSLLFDNLPAVFEVGLYHSWVVSQDHFPVDLHIDALSDDGLIMSLSHKNYNIYGLQFHPESYITQYGQQMIKNFIYA